MTAAALAVLTAATLTACGTPRTREVCEAAGGRWTGTTLTLDTAELRARIRIRPRPRTTGSTRTHHHWWNPTHDDRCQIPNR